MTGIYILVNGLILTIFVLSVALAIAVRQNKQLHKELKRRQEKSR